MIFAESWAQRELRLRGRLLAISRAFRRVHKMAPRLNHLYRQEAMQAALWRTYRVLSAGQAGRVFKMADVQEGRTTWQ